MTNRGRPVTKIVPYVSEPRRSRIEEMIVRGEITPATGSITDLLPPHPALPGRCLSEVLQDRRDDERY